MNALTQTKGFVFFVIFMSTSSVVMSQIQEISPSLISTQINHPVEGTYQIVLSDKRMVEPTLTEAILNQVSLLREQNTVVYYVIDAYTKIRIFPFSDIDDQDFIKPKKCVYEN